MTRDSKLYVILQWPWLHSQNITNGNSRFLVPNPILSFNLTLQLTKLPKDIERQLANVSRFIIRSIQIEDKFVIRVLYWHFCSLTVVVWQTFHKTGVFRNSFPDTLSELPTFYVDKNPNGLHFTKHILDTFHSTMTRIKVSKILMIAGYTL